MELCTKARLSLRNQGAATGSSDTVLQPNRKSGVHWQRPVLLYESDMARNEIMRLRTANANRAPGPSRSRTADAARVAIPLLIAFAAPSSLVVERDRPSQFPILGNGPPGTFVLFPGRLRVSLPTDQVVSADDTGGCAKVGFGGMRFTGMASGRLVFVRERDLHPADQLSPDRSHTMRLEPQWVASIFAYGQLLWP